MEPQQTFLHRLWTNCLEPEGIMTLTISKPSSMNDQVQIIVHQSSTDKDQKSYWDTIRPLVISGDIVQVSQDFFNLLSSISAQPDVVNNAQDVRQDIQNATENKSELVATEKKPRGKKLQEKKEDPFNIFKDQVTDLMSQDKLSDALALVNRSSKEFEKDKTHKDAYAKLRYDVQLAIQRKEMETPIPVKEDIVLTTPAEPVTEPDKEDDDELNQEIDPELQEFPDFNEELIEPETEEDPFQ